uniref:Outer dense fiber protein 3 n=1 Tax=Cuerna arida TaxID=1464854 RepID=A0A1B6EKU7_9HEMI
MAFLCPLKDSGPGYYMLPSTVGSNSDISRTGSPAYSFGSRPAAGRLRQAPGPQAYDISHLTRYGRSTVPACVLAGRLLHGGWYPSAKNVSPGPGAYSPEVYGSMQWKCSTQHHCQRYSAPRKLAKTSCTPGPGAYDTPVLDAYKTRQPRVKMPPSLHTLRD